VSKILKPKILVIDDESAFREGLIETLEDLGYETSGASGARPALSLLRRESFDLVFVDFRMPELDGVETMKLIRDEKGAQAPPMVMLTAFSDSQNTIEAMRAGAFDHLAKPISRDDVKRVTESILKVFAHECLRTCEDRKVESSKQNDGRARLIGRSEKFRDILKLVGRLAATETTVLIAGETGTGKEVVAQSIHQNSSRSSGPFVAVNCAAIPENLLESELFGHVRGAFTGASQDRKGSFQLAQGGTLFLDEIGDMNMTLQAKILRAVQEREVTPVGATKPVRVDCRIIAATHQNLRAMVERHEFREDLFYRLNVVQIDLPPLRDRKSDIEDLCQFFLSNAEIPGLSLSEAALEKLKRHTWPGNIRELKNVIDRATVIVRGRVITEDEVRLIDLASPLKQLEASDLDWHQAIARLERELLVTALQSAKGNRSEAARRLGIQRQLLYAKMKEHQISDER
jgi:two-component system NtrC family response regulator